MRFMIDHGYKALSQGSDIASSSRSRQTDETILALHLRGIQVPETVYLGCAQESKVDSSRLQQAHDSHHVETLRSVEKVGWIGHGVNQFRRWPRANDTVFKQPN